MFTFNIRGTVYTARTLAGISAAYCKARDESGEGASTFPFPDIEDGGAFVARLSYNGRVWPYGAYGESLPLYDPAADPVPAMLAALKAAETSIDFTLKSRGYVDGSCSDDWAECVRREVAARATIRAAIAKAESALT